MSVLVSYDPGLREAGIALFHGKVLHRAALLRNPVEKLRGPSAWRAMAKEAAKWVGGPVDVAVVEMMQVYGGKWAANPADLMQLVGVDGAVCMSIDAKAYVDYLPRSWKGQVPQATYAKRIDALLKKTGESEAVEECPASLRHNVLHAVGLGLFHLGRINVGCTEIYGSVPTG